MRLFILVLAATCALLSSGTVASHMTNGESMSSPNQVFSSETEGRRLRMHKSSIDDIEERKFNEKKFERLMNDQSYRSTRFSNWVSKKYTDRYIYDLLRIDSNPNYRRILTKYQTYIEHYAPKLISL